MKIITIVGARPQFVKAAMISRAIADLNRRLGYTGIDELILHSGQHYDDNMSRVFFEQMQIPQPKWRLDGKDKTVPQLVQAIKPIIAEEKPDYVLLYGDTNTTLAGCISAHEAGTDIIHIEAGLRSFNNDMPEEYNRVYTDRHSSLLFCPTRTAVDNLHNEGITDGVYHSGDVMYDAALCFTPVAKKQSSILQTLDIHAKQYILATIHRAENTVNKDILLSILNAFADIASDQCPIIWPIHPRTLALVQKETSLQQILQGNKRIRIINPVPYLDMITLEHSAKCIMTDSGGIQKEAYFHRVPCITLRNETEWTETVDAGWNQIAGTETDYIIECYNTTMYRTDIAEYGTGHAADNIIAEIWQSGF